MRYILLSGPQGAVNTFEGGFDNTKEADERAAELEDNGNFCEIIDREGGLIYSSDDKPLPDLEVDGERDLKTKLKPGQGVWLEVEDEDGDKLVVRAVIDIPTRGLAVRVFTPGTEDQTPVDELLINF